ncbi:LysR substrate-binding domain-containing protein [Bradyrhizobium sp. 139]|uniref:LysR substrate-binding domain-containing protein n=1 Tax=Bradyrhizobium sp. 139 TaxID=2782616 RepID=UPI001FF85B82|nr:LysR substrate-binding domain-containing protein [Bradyrhizobium sp. 139]
MKESPCGPPARASPPSKALGAALRLTHLLALQAFDLAFKFGSFQKAARALNLTASAISHRIRNLERMLGVSLFIRTHRAIKPSAEGKRLAVIMGRAFAQLARARLASSGGRTRQRLTLKVFPLFASAWLIPRLSTFIAQHPDIDVVIETSSRMVDFDIEAYDAGICVSDPQPTSLKSLHLAHINAMPVATPALARRLRLRRPQDLRRAVLIQVASFPRAWPEWLARAGVPDLLPLRTITVDSFVSAIQAAEQGVAVALGMDLFIRDQEKQARICQLFSTVSPAGSYWLMSPPENRENRALTAFKRWLSSEAIDLHSN